MFLLVNNVQKIMSRKIVGFTSIFNPRYNIVTEYIRQTHSHSPTNLYLNLDLNLNFYKNKMNNCIECFKSNSCDTKKTEKDSHTLIPHPVTKPRLSLSSIDQTKIYLQENQFIQNKKIISISPGGLKGFYLMGIVAYIKENYSLEPYIFSGASAGAWNALLMTFKKDPIEVTLKIIDDSIKNVKSISELEHIMKYKILESYKTDDFDLQRLFIGITTIGKFKINTKIYSEFEDLEDALNCCIASSHIPFITGGLTTKYNDVYAFDGGFSNYPYLNITKPVLHITPSMWETTKQSKQNEIMNYSMLFSKGKYDFMNLFDKGYNDAKDNKAFLDSVLVLQN